MAEKKEQTYVEMQAEAIRNTEMQAEARRNAEKLNAEIQELNKEIARLKAENERMEKGDTVSGMASTVYWSTEVEKDRENARSITRKEVYEANKLKMDRLRAQKAGKEASLKTLRAQQFDQATRDTAEKLRMFDDNGNSRFQFTPKSYVEEPERPTVPFRSVEQENQQMTREEVEETMSDDAKKATKAKKVIGNNRTYTARPIEGLKTLDGIGLPSGMTIPEPNRPDIKIGEVKFQPTVTVVPRIKKNGKLSKRFNDIMYTDENNQQHRITKDVVKAMGKSWKETLKAAEECKLKPKDAAKFFETKAKEQPTPVKVSETTTDKRKYTDKNGYEVTFAHDDNGVCTSMTIKAPGGMQYTVTAEDYTKKGYSGPETLKGDYAFVSEISNPEYSDFTAMYKTAKEVGHNTTEYAYIPQKGKQNG